MIAPFISRFCCILLFAAISLSPAGAIQPLFDNDSPVAITLEAPFSRMMSMRESTEPHSAVLAYTESDGSMRRLDIKLELRGNFRRQLANCSFAPLRIDLKKGDVSEGLFSGQNRLKMVTDCLHNRGVGQQLVLREYLAYRMLNLFTENSFRARLLKVTYIDSEQAGEWREAVAFVIEDKKRLAERIGKKRLKVKKTSYGTLDPQHTNLMNLYQYLIGNTDYSLVQGPEGDRCCHNAVLYGNDQEPIFSIPYDFDTAGLVDAPYAIPNPRFNIKDVTNRHYRGRCRNNELLSATLAQFEAQRDAIKALINSTDSFSKRSRKKALNYIAKFYARVSSNTLIERNLIRRCL